MKSLLFIVGIAMLSFWGIDLQSDNGFFSDFLPFVFGCSIVSLLIWTVFAVSDGKGGDGGSGGFWGGDGGSSCGGGDGGC